MRRLLRCVPAVLVAAAAAACATERGEDDPTGTTQSAIVTHSPLWVGVRCQQDYQNNWQPLLTQVYQNCWDFGDQMSRYDQWTFYYNLHGAAPVLSATNDGAGIAAGGADSVDLLFLYTHGSLNPKYRHNLPQYYMWDELYSVYPDKMRLGDTGVGASILATYSCDTMSFRNGKTWEAWYPAFAGGLRIALGAHDVLYDVKGTGRGFASNMQTGLPLASSWHQALLAGDSDNHPIAITTGRNPDDCWSRHGMSIVDVKLKERLKDSAIGYMCWSYWNDPYTGDTPARRNAAAQSLTHGFLHSKLAVLQRVPGPTRASLAKTLAANFCQGCAPEITDGPVAGAHVRVPGWSFDTTADGNATAGVIDNQQARARAIAQKLPNAPSDAKMGGLARDFVASKLASLVVLGSADELVASSIGHNVEGGTDGRGTDASQVVATRIVLTRRFEKTPVVGSGSAIVVTMANDGTPLSFAYDWPGYTKQGLSQTILPAGDILRRLQKVVGIETNATSLPALVPPDSASYPYDLLNDTAVQIYECGYVDSGDPSRAPSASIQPGCSFRALQLTTSTLDVATRTGVAGAIPGGVSFLADDHWAESMLLSGKTLKPAPDPTTARQP